jgi:hypothetical protein
MKKKLLIILLIIKVFECKNKIKREKKLTLIP